MFQSATFQPMQKNDYTIIYVNWWSNIMDKTSITTYHWVLWWRYLEWHDQVWANLLPQLKLTAMTF